MGREHSKEWELCIPCCHLYLWIWRAARQCSCVFYFSHSQLLRSRAEEARGWIWQELVFAGSHTTGGKAKRVNEEVLILTNLGIHVSIRKVFRWKDQCPQWSQTVNGVEVVEYVRWKDRRGWPKNKLLGSEIWGGEVVIGEVKVKVITVGVGGWGGDTIKVLKSQNMDGSSTCRL